MAKEEKKLLLNVLKDGLPYGLKLQITDDDGFTFNGELRVLSKNWCRLNIADPVKRAKIKNPTIPLNCIYIKPYLRPMSSMTDEEREEFRKTGGVMSYSPQHDTWAISAFAPEAYDWLNKNKFDYRGLIPMGLALEAAEGMYSIQKSDDELKKDVAKKLIDVLIYDNDYVNRMTPLDESRHYGNWIDYVAKSVIFPDRDKEWWDKEDRIDIFAVGDYHDKEDMIRNYPSLRELDTVLNEYYDYLNEEFKN